MLPGVKVIVPIIDLRTRFGIETTNYTGTTVIIVLKLRFKDHLKTIGIVVDAVSDVLDIPHSAIKKVDEVNSQSEAITGVATVNDKLVIMMDAARLVDATEFADLEGSISE